MTDEQIKDIFEAELNKLNSWDCIIRPSDSHNDDIFDGCYSTAEDAMLETVKIVIASLKKD